MKFFVVNSDLPRAPDDPVAAAWEAIKAERDRRTFAGVKVGQHWIHTDTFSRTQWLGMVLAGASLPAIAWTTLDKAEVTTTPALAGQVFQAVMVSDSALFAIAKAKRVEMESSEDPAAYDVTDGWPLSFGE